MQDLDVWDLNKELHPVR